MILISFNTPPAFLHHHVGEPPLVFFAGNTLLSVSLPRERYPFFKIFVQGMKIKFIALYILYIHTLRFYDKWKFSRK